MRILLSAYAFDPDRGSESGNGWAWATTLAARGHEVVVLTAPDGATTPATGRAGAGSVRVVRVPLPPAASPLLRGWAGVYVRYLLWLRASLREARREHAAVPFDVVHHVTWGSLLWGCPLWRLGVPFVFGPVGGGQVTPASLRAYFGAPWWTERARTFVVRRLLSWLPAPRAAVRRALLVLATNGDTLELVRRMGAHRSLLVIDTATPARFLARPVPSGPGPEEPLRLLWIGRLLPRKGVTLALEALRRVPPEVDWRLTIVGDGPLAGAVSVRIAEHPDRDRISWLGQLAWPDVERAYERSTAMLFTSLRDSSGAQLYEAMAFGLPVIALDHHGARDLLPPEAALKVPIRDAEGTADAVAGAVTALARDPGLRAAMGRAALAFARRSTWEAKVAEVYATISSAATVPAASSRGGTR